MAQSPVDALNGKCGPLECQFYKRCQNCRQHNCQSSSILAPKLSIVDSYIPTSLAADVREQAKCPRAMNRPAPQVAMKK